jgi:integrase/recombinase XerD
MTSYNAANERMKRQYFAYLTEAQGYSEQSIDAVAKAIARFEAYTRCKDFKAFHIEQRGPSSGTLPSSAAEVVSR